MKLDALCSFARERINELIKIETMEKKEQRTETKNIEKLCVPLRLCGYKELPNR